MSDVPLLLGHRGARVSGTVPENTCASFDLALEHGCDGFEFDVRLTAGGEAVVCHNPRVGGITVSRASRDQLARLPRLGEVLQRYGRRTFLDIELKVRDLESKTLTALREHLPGFGYVVSSFIPDVVMELEARSPSVSLGIICDKRTQLARWRKLPIEYVMAHQSLVDRKLVRDVKGAGKKLFVWTVNDKAAMMRLRDWGVDGIISDQTQLLVHTLGRKGRDRRVGAGN
jgi:glycerophosphoryl diester phosphodiesterase